jgi:hypothetical protein
MTMTMEKVMEEVKRKREFLKTLRNPGQIRRSSNPISARKTLVEMQTHGSLQTIKELWKNGIEVAPILTI